MAKRDDGLFLLEVLIDKIVLAKSPCFTDKEFKTCVLISCSAMPPLELCDTDSGGGPQTGGSFVISFNNGKSCLFALQESEITAATSKFPVTVSAYKTLPCGCLPAKIALGEATIDLTKEFVQARNKYLEDPNAVSCEALKDSFKLTADGETTGEIVMFLRISCFGKQIVTRFQGGSGPPNLGGAVESTIVDRSCNPPRDFQMAGAPCACSRGQGAQGGGGGAPCPAHGGGAVCPPARDPYNSMPCEDPDDPCYCTGPKTPAKQPMACRNTDQYCLHVPKGRSKQFEEIGTNLGGNELKIKVPATAAIIKKISQTHCAMQCPYLKGGKYGGICVAPCGKNQISLALPSEATCCRGAQLADTQFTCTTEGCAQVSKHGQQAAMARGTDCCPTGNKVIFQMPQDSCGMNHKQRAHFNFTSDGVGDMARDDPAQLMPTTAQAYPGVVYDFPRQVIKLRIGKTVEMPGRKSKLEYQFITPAVNYEKMVPVKDTRTAQCVPCCCGSCRTCCRRC